MSALVTNIGHVSSVRLQQRGSLSASCPNAFKVKPHARGPSFARRSNTSSSRGQRLEISANYIWLLHSQGCKDAAVNPAGATKDCNVDQVEDLEINITELLANAGGKKGVDDEYVTIGSNPETADFVLQWEHIDDQHARFMITGADKDILMIENLSSHNGTQIDEKVLDGGQRVQLVPGQVLRLGDTFVCTVERNVFAHA